MPAKDEQQICVIKHKNRQFGAKGRILKSADLTAGQCLLTAALVQNPWLLIFSILFNYLFILVYKLYKV